jgi:hypothetical protein
MSMFKDLQYVWWVDWHDKVITKRQNLLAIIASFYVDRVSVFSGHGSSCPLVS